MKKTIIMTFAALAMLMAACGNKNGGGSEGGAPDGYKTYDFPGFSISCPPEMIKSDALSSDEHVQFTSDAKVKHADGSEQTSSFNLDATFQDGGAVGAEGLAEYAKNLKYLQENQMGYTCEGPKVDGGTMTMRGTKGEGDRTTVTTFYSVVAGGGKAVSGSISYLKAEAGTYDAVVEPIIKSIKIK